MWNLFSKSPILFAMWIVVFGTWHCFDLWIRGSEYLWLVLVGECNSWHLPQPPFYLPTIACSQLAATCGRPLNISSLCISSGWALARTSQGQQWARVCSIWSGFHSENPITWYWKWTKVSINLQRYPFLLFWNDRKCIRCQPSGYLNVEIGAGGCNWAIVFAFLNVFHNFYPLSLSTMLQKSKMCKVCTKERLTARLSYGAQIHLDATKGKCKGSNPSSLATPHSLIHVFNRALDAKLGGF